MHFSIIDPLIPFSNWLYSHEPLAICRNFVLFFYLLSAIRSFGFHLCQGGLRGLFIKRYNAINATNATNAFCLQPKAFSLFYSPFVKVVRGLFTGNNSIYKTK